MRTRHLVTWLTLATGVTLVALLALVLSRPTSAQGTTYYVDASTGSDLTGDGSLGNPWKTIFHAAAQVPAGTAADPNTIQVAAGTYDATTNGESFPITLTHAYVRLVGAGAGSAIIDGAGVADVISVTATGLAIQGFSIQNAAGSGVAASAGGLTVTQNAFSGVDQGVYLLLHQTPVSGTLVVSGVAVVSNTFAVTSTGVYLDLLLSGQGTAADLTVGDLRVLSNTVALPAGAGTGVDLFQLAVEVVNGGQITIGQVVIADNQVTGGQRGIATYGYFYLITDTRVIAGDLIVTGNTLRDQAQDGIHADYYDAYDWIGATYGHLGALVVSDNQIESAAAGSDGIDLDDLGYWSDLYHDSSIHLGDVTVENNQVDVGAYGVRLVWENARLHDNADLTLGRTIVSRNTLTATNGIWLDMDLSDIDTSVADITVGSLVFLSNTILLSGTTGVGIDLVEIWINGPDLGLVDVGDVTIAGNQVSGGQRGIWFWGQLFDLADTTLNVGDLIVTGNQLLDQDSAGISLDYYDADEWSGNATGIMGRLVASDNQIESAAANSDGIRIQDLGCWENLEDVSLTVGELAVESNQIDVERRGIYVIYEEVELLGTSSLTLTAVSISSNTIDAERAVYLYLDLTAMDTHSARVVIGDLDFLSNTLTLSSTTGAGIDLGGIDVDGPDDGEVEIGALTIAGNRVTGGRTGINAWGRVSDITNTAVTAGDWVVTGNELHGQIDDAIRINGWDAAHWRGLSTGDLGALVVSDNEIQSGAANSDGIDLTGLGDWTEIHDDIPLTLGDVALEDNRIDVGAWGVWVTWRNAALKDQSILTLGRTSVNSNTVHAQDGICLDMNLSQLDTTGSGVTVGSLEFLSNTVVLSGTAGYGIDLSEIWINGPDDGQADVGDLTISGNQISGGDTGIYFWGEVYDISGTLVTVGDVLVAGNRLQDQAVDGIYVDYYDAKDWHGASSGTLGSLTVSGNDVQSAAAGSSGIAIDDLGWWYSFHDDARLTVGDVAVENNRVDVAANGVQLYWSDIDLFDDSALTLGRTSVSSNTVSATQGILLDVDLGASWLGSGDVTMGNLEVLSNTVALSGTAGTGIDFPDVYIGSIDQAAIDLGDVVISGNQVSGGDTGISFWGEVYGISGTVVTLGDVVVTGNRLLDPYSDGILIDYYDAGRWEGASLGTFGALRVSDNRIESAAPGSDGIVIDDLGWWYDLYRDTSLTLGDVAVENNWIEVDASGVQIDWLHVALRDNAELTLGRTSVNSNTVHAQDGIWLDMDLSQLDTTGSGVTVGSLEFLSNTVILSGTAGYGIDLSEIWINGPDEGRVEIGDLTISGNQISGGYSGIYFWGEVSDISGTVVTVGDVLIAGNRLQDQAVDGIYVDYYDASDWYGASSGALGALTVSGNLIQSAAAGSNGIAIDDLGWWCNLRDHASLDVGEVAVEDNWVSVDSYGVQLWWSDIDLHDDAALTVGPTSVSSNTVEAENGLYLEVDLPAALLGAGLEMGPVQVQRNRVQAAAAGLEAYDDGGVAGSDGASADWVIDRNTVVGGAEGAYLDLAGEVVASNNLFAGQRDTGLYLETGGTTAYLLHNTIASPTLSSGAAVYIYTGTAHVTDTLIASYTVGIENLLGTVTEDYNLFFGNTYNLSGTVASGGHSQTGLDPRFVDPAGGDYHLRRSSPAVDAGADAGITWDIDGELRPYGGGFDVGADEMTRSEADLVITKTVSPTSAAPGQPVSYRLECRNAGPDAAPGIRISDPVQASLSDPSYTYAGPPVTPTGAFSYTWSAGTLALGEGGVITVTGTLTRCLAAGSTVSNTAAISVSVTDPDRSNNRSGAWLAVLNAPPAAAGDRYRVPADTPLSVAAPGVLANDDDPNCEPLPAVWVSGPDNGTLALAADGSFVYTPTAGYLGSDSFTYRACDGAAPPACDTGRVTLRVRIPPPVGGLNVSAADRLDRFSETWFGCAHHMCQVWGLAWMLAAAALPLLAAAFRRRKT